MLYDVERLEQAGQHSFDLFAVVGEWDIAVHAQTVAVVQAWRRRNGNVVNVLFDRIGVRCKHIFTVSRLTLGLL